MRAGGQVKVWLWIKANPVETVAILTGVQLWLENLAHKRGWKWAAVTADLLACLPFVAKLSGPNPRPADPAK